MYILFELQTTNGVTAIVTPQTFDNKGQADSAAHMALASAAVSSVDVHTVMLVNEQGAVIRREGYDHVNGTYFFDIGE